MMKLLFLLIATITILLIIVSAVVIIVSEEADNACKSHYGKGWKVSELNGVYFCEDPAGVLKLP